MRSFLRFFTRRAHFQAPKEKSYGRKTASLAASTIALPVAMFSSTVTKPSRLGAVPEDADAKSHHVMNKKGERVKFHNPHTSFQSVNMVAAIAELQW
jgi:hypothetical protein